MSCNSLGYKMICGCGCNQILLECNHVGCPRSEGMRKELLAAITGRGGPGGDSDDESRGGKGAGSSSGPADNSDNAILQSFVDRYGPTILAAPTMSGFNLTAWITPFAVLLAAFASAVLVVHSWKKRPLRAIAASS